MKKPTTFSLHTAYLDNHVEVNNKLIIGLNNFIDNESTRKSHHFFGRYENIYIDSDKIPELDIIVNAVKTHAENILNIPAQNLKAGLWFNVMNPGDKTTLHRHDDDDELLSSVYYITVSENSGLLELNKKPIQTQVTPEEGLFVFFPPDLPHSVSENKSDQCRVSLGINIGPA